MRNIYLHCSVKFRQYVCNKTNMNDIMKNFAMVIIYNKNMYVTQIEESAAYSLDQLFSDIGKNSRLAISVYAFA